MTPSNAARLDGGRPALRADAARNRQRILDAAEVAFGAEGLAVPVDEIARRAGVGAGTLYRHFPTKEALFEAVLVQHITGLAEQVGSLVDAEHPGETLFAFLRQLADQASAHRNLYEAVTGSGVDIKAAAAGPKAILDAAMETLLARAQAAGEVRSDITLPELLTLVMGACTFNQVDPTVACSPHRMLDVVCDGLRVSGGNSA